MPSCLKHILNFGFSNHISTNLSHLLPLKFTCLMFEIIFVCFELTTSSFIHCEVGSMTTHLEFVIPLCSRSLILFIPRLLLHLVKWRPLNQRSSNRGSFKSTFNTFMHLWSLRLPPYVLWWLLISLRLPHSFAFPRFLSAHTYLFELLPIAVTPFHIQVSIH